MLDTVSDITRSTQTNRLPALTASDPSSVFAIKSLLHPTVAVLCLLASLLAWSEPLDGQYFLLGVLTFFAAAELLDLSEVGHRSEIEPSVAPLLDITIRWLLVIALLWALLYVSGSGERIRSEVFATWAATTPLALWLAETGVSRLLHHATQSLQAPRKAVIVGVTDVGRRLAQRLEADPLLNVEVMGYFDERDPGRLAMTQGERLLGDTGALPRYVARHGINAVYVTLPVTSAAQLSQIYTRLQDSTASIYFVPDLFTFDMIQARVTVIGGIPLLAVRESPFYGARAIVKRICDVVIAAALLLAAAPLLLLVAMGVRLSSPGPIIFKQRRYGLDGEEIYIYKFRSMTVTEDGAAQYTQVTRGDDRVTPFGAFIRRMSLDELPQLFNVLRGTLSLIGPRPHAIAVNEQYRRLIPGYMLRHKVKPGITGWAQVNGYRGGDDLESMTKRIECDLEYLRHWSLGLDVWIMLRTVALIWRDSRAY